MPHAVVLAWIAFRADVRLRPAAVVFACTWGAGVAAPAAALTNDVLAHAGAAGWRLAVVWVPPLEEAAKAGVLLALLALAPAALRGIRPGIVVGALVGLGFGLAENVDYLLLAAVQEGPLGLLRAIAVRGVLEGAVHPVLTATMGAGLGMAAAVPLRPRPALLAFGAATAQHAVWNGLASGTVTAILCNGLGPGGACRGDPGPFALLVAVPLVVAAALAPGIAGLVVLARRTGPAATPPA